MINKRQVSSVFAGGLILLPGNCEEEVLGGEGGRRSPSDVVQV